MQSSRITSKWQTTVPRAVREKLRLKPGDTLVYVERGQSVILMRQSAPEAAEDPFASFSEWRSDADAQGYAKL